MTTRKTKPVKLENKQTGGRARVAIDKTVLKSLAAIGASQKEIVDGLIAAGCTLDLRTLKRRLEEPEFRSIYDAGLNGMKMGLRRTQLKHTLLPNSAGVSMAIHLGKHFLGQSDKSLLELTGKDGGSIQFDYSKLSHDQLSQLETILAGVAASGGNAGGDQGGAPPATG